AFDILLTDTVDSALSLVSVVLDNDLGYIDVTDATAGNVISLTLDELREGDTATFTITATVNPTVTVGQVIANAARIEYSSLPGIDPNERGGDETPVENDY